MSKDQRLYSMRYAEEFEYNNVQLFSKIMFALFKNDPTKHIVIERELQLNREDLQKVLDTLFELLKLDVGEPLNIGDVELIKDYSDDERIFCLIRDFKDVLRENPKCDDFKFTNY